MHHIWPELAHLLPECPQGLQEIYRAAHVVNTEELNARTAEQRLVTTT